MGLVFAIPNFLTFNLLSGLFTFIITVATFMIAASLVHGFRLRLGYMECGNRCDRAFFSQQPDLQLYLDALVENITL
jgi:hypothetical protein